MSTLETVTDARAQVVPRVAEWLRTLNEKEVERRVEVNRKHVAEYGRELYPEGGQYAVFSLASPGRKFTRVKMRAGGQTSVHAFVDLATGDVYKAAGWRAPAKGARFNVLDDASFARLLERSEFTGGYLYAGRQDA